MFACAKKRVPQAPSPVAFDFDLSRFRSNATAEGYALFLRPARRMRKASNWNVTPRRPFEMVSRREDRARISADCLSTRRDLSSADRDLEASDAGDVISLAMSRTAGLVIPGKDY